MHQTLEPLLSSALSNPKSLFRNYNICYKPCNQCNKEQQERNTKIIEIHLNGKTVLHMVARRIGE